MYAVEPVRTFHLGVLSSGAGPRHFAHPMLTRLWETLSRLQQGLLLMCQKLGQMESPGLLTSVLSCRPIVP